MPIKLVQPREGKTPYFYARGSYLGQRVNRSTGTSKRAVALKVIAKWEREIERGEFSEPGEPTFASAAAAYMRAGGERTYLRRLLEHFGDKPLRQIGQAEIDAAAIALAPNVSAATRNRGIYTPVSAVLKCAGIKLDLRRPRGSGGNKQTVWLWPEQAHALFAEAEKLDPKFAALLIVLCYTGMRLSEALGLTWDRVRLQDGYAYIPDTKNDEPRAVFLPPVAVAALGNLDASRARVFRLSKSGHIYSLLRVSAIRAGVDLPERSAFHILRHTFMSWMRRYGGLDEIGLLSLGTHKDRKSVERYTHAVAPEEAKKAGLLPTPGRKTG